MWERVWGEWGSVLGRDMGGGVGKCEVGKERCGKVYGVSGKVCWGVGERYQGCREVC